MSGNPILTLLDLNGSLQGQDRNGIFTATGSGALRYAPAPGARVNRVLNARFATDTSSWLRSPGAATLSRVADGRFAGGFAAEVGADTINYGIVQRLSLLGAGVANGGYVTVSFDAVAVSGATDWHVRVLEVSPGGSGGTFHSFTAQPDVTRHVIVIPISGYGAFEKLDFYIRRQSSAAGVIRISNIVYEVGNLPSASYFENLNGWFDPLTGGLGAAHASMNASRLVSWVEEATTNYVKNPSFENGTTTNWLPNGSFGSSVVTTRAYLGTQCCEHTRGAASGSEGIQTAVADSPTITPGQTWTWSMVLANSVTVDQARLAIAWCDASDAVLSVDTLVIPSLGPQWLRAILVATAPANAAKVRLQAYTTSGTVGDKTWYDCAQFEQKAYATSICIGDMGAGYSFAGTAHASASSRAVTTLSFDGVNRIRSTAGEFHARVSMSAPLNITRRLFEIGVQPTAEGQGDFLFAGPATNVGRMGGKTGITAQMAVGLIPFAADSWHVMGGSWSQTAYEYLDYGVEKRTSVRTTPDGFFRSSNILYVGSALWPYALNGLIGPVAIYETPLSDTRRSMVNTAIDNGDDLWSLFAGNPYTFFQLRPY